MSKEAGTVEKGINIIVYVYVPCADHIKPFKKDEFPTKSCHEKWVTSKVRWVLYCFLLKQSSFQTNLKSTIFHFEAHYIKGSV